MVSTVEVRGRLEIVDHRARVGLNKIQDERHSYEKCQYEEFKQRVKKMDEIRAAKDGARSN